MRIARSACIRSHSAVPNKTTTRLSWRAAARRGLVRLAAVLALAGGLLASTGQLSLAVAAGYTLACTTPVDASQPPGLSVSTNWNLVTPNVAGDPNGDPTDSLAVSNLAVGDTVTFRVARSSSGGSVNGTFGESSGTATVTPALPLSFTQSSGSTPTNHVFTVTATGNGLKTFTITKTGQSSGGDKDIEWIAVCHKLVPAPSLNVAKSASVPGGSADLGETITYTISVQNTGNVPLTGVTVNDPMLGGAMSGATSIAVGATATYTGTYIVQQSDIDTNGGGDGTIDNTVTADSNETGPDTASVAVAITAGQEQHGDVNLTCPDADSDGLCKGGGLCNSIPGEQNNPTDNIDLTNVLAGTLVTVTATNIHTTTADVDFAGLALSPDPMSLAPGETKTATFTAGASGTANFQIQLTGNNQRISYDVACVSPGNITIRKETAGGTGTFTFDTQLNGSPSSFNIATLAENSPVGHPVTASIGTYVFTEQALDGWELTGIECTGGGSVTVDQPNRKVTVTVTAANIADAPICTFKNKKQAATLTLNKTVVDLPGGANEPATAWTLTATPVPSGTASNVQHGGVLTLSPGTYALTESTIASYTQQSLTCATAAGAPVALTNTNQLTLADGDNVICTFVNAEDADPSIDIVKTFVDVTDTDSSGGLTAGDVANYSITATNTGNVTLIDVDVTDNDAATMLCSPATPVDLDPQEATTCTATLEITQEQIDAGSVSNTATASGKPPSGPDVSDSDTETVPLTRTPLLEITKGADVSSVDAAGDLINYTITVTNAGNTTLTNVLVADAFVSNLDCTPAAPVSNLAPGAGISCTASHVVSQPDIDFGGAIHS
ncbi:MAG: hypothetical protein R3D57_06830 [Hyphomicrobiaceae bacterium]